MNHTNFATALFLVGLVMGAAVGSAVVISQKDASDQRVADLTSQIDVLRARQASDQNRIAVLNATISNLTQALVVPKAEFAYTRNLSIPNELFFYITWINDGVLSKFVWVTVTLTSATIGPAPSPAATVGPWKPQHESLVVWDGFDIYNLTMGAQYHLVLYFTPIPNAVLYDTIFTFNG